MPHIQISKRKYVCGLNLKVLFFWMSNGGRHIWMKSCKRKCLHIIYCKVDLASLRCTDFIGGSLHSLNLETSPQMYLMMEINLNQWRKIKIHQILNFTLDMYYIFYEKGSNVNGYGVNISLLNVKHLFVYHFQLCYFLAMDLTTNFTP